jgi:F-type H+-transporting ATPase subunit a
MTEGLGPRAVFWVEGGPFDGFVITETTVWTIIIVIGLIIFARRATRDLKDIPRGAQAVAELVFEYASKFVRETMGPHCVKFVHFIATLFCFLVIANALGLIGMRPVTSDMNATFALSISIFFIIQYNSIKTHGALGYIRHFGQPYAFMYPIKIMEEISFPISLSFRCFGNILAGYIIMELLFEALGHASAAIGSAVPFLQIGIPLPANFFFDMFEPVLQSFVFTMLTMVFISKAMVFHEAAEVMSKGKESK